MSTSASPLPEYYDDEYIYYQEGNIPIVMTFPHSGWLRINGVETRKKGVLDKDDYTNIMAVLMLQCFNCSLCGCPPNCCSGNIVNNNNNNNNNNTVTKDNSLETMDDDDDDQCCQSKDVNSTSTATSCCQEAQSSDNNSNTNTNTSVPSCCQDNQQTKDGAQKQRCCCCASSTYPLDMTAFNFDPACARPFIIYSKVNREICDMNRESERAYEDDRMIPHYNLYHDTIASFVKKATALAKDRASRVVLLDMHGQSDLRDHILRGTKDLDTVQPMLREVGLHSIIGPNSIMGYLHSNGVPTFPTRVPLLVDPSQTADVVPTARGKAVLNAFQEHPHFNGGHTVRHYSSQYGINCIQIEIGIKWRQNEENRLHFARLLRDSILNYYKHYLMEETK